jgi:hypothetical protein
MWPTDASSSGAGPGLVQSPLTDQQLRLAQAAIQATRRADLLLEAWMILGKLCGSNPYDKSFVRSAAIRCQMDQPFSEQLKHMEEEGYRVWHELGKALGMLE